MTPAKRKEKACEGPPWKADDKVEPVKRQTKKTAAPQTYFDGAWVDSTFTKLGEKIDLIQTALDKSELHDALDKIGKQVEWVQRSMALAGVVAVLAAALLIVLLR